MILRKLFLFDFDGVLVDSLGYYEDSLRRSLEKIGRPVVKTREDYLDLFEDNLYQSLLNLGINLEEFFEANRRGQSRLDCHLLKPFLPLIPVLEDLRERHTLAVVSSNSTDLIEGILLHNGFRDCFCGILGAEFSLSKEEKIRQARSLWPAPAEETYYVGDTSGDVREARQAGVKAIAVLWGWHDRDRLARAGPDYLVAKPEELLAI